MRYRLQAVSALLGEKAENGLICIFVAGDDPSKVLDSFSSAGGEPILSFQMRSEKYCAQLDCYFRPLLLRKLQERIWVEKARRQSLIFPDGEIVDSERPDFLLYHAKGLVGVEVTTVWQSASESPKTPKAVAGIHESIVKIAKRRYDHSLGPQQDVQVIFAPGAEIDEGQEVLVTRLLNFVLQNGAEGLHRGWLHREFRGAFPSGFRWIGIHPPEGGGGVWQCSHAGNAQELEKFEIATSIAAKDRLISDYRSKALINWLLLVIPSRSWGSPPVPRDTRHWRFPSSFEKVLLFPIEDDEVFDLTPD